jgi:hypothetical protein
MKKMLLLFIVLAPAWTFAGNGGDKKTGKNHKEINIRIQSGKDGSIEITGLDKSDMKDLERDLNKALKHITVKFDDGKEKHELHFNADIKID